LDLCGHHCGSKISLKNTILNDNLSLQEKIKLNLTPLNKLNQRVKNG
jgi:hypothetical protein